MTAAWRPRWLRPGLRPCRTRPRWKRSDRRSSSDEARRALRAPRLEGRKEAENEALRRLAAERARRQSDLEAAERRLAIDLALLPDEARASLAAEVRPPLPPPKPPSPPRPPLSRRCAAKPPMPSACASSRSAWIASAPPARRASSGWRSSTAPSPTTRARSRSPAARASARNWRSCVTRPRSGAPGQEP